MTTTAASNHSRPPTAPEAGSTSHARSGSGLGTAGWWILKIAIALWCVFNVALLAWVVLNSFRGGSAIFSRPLELPDSIDFDNYVSAWTTSNLARGFVNSLLLVGVCTVITVMLAAMAAYVLARNDVRTAGPIISFFAIGLGIPVQVVLVPLWAWMNHLSAFMYATVGWWDERISLGLLYTATSLPFAVFLLTGFFRSLPSDLEEAAALDGASAWTTFFRIMAPLARPGLLSAGMLTAMGLWNETLLALVFITDNSKYTLPQALLALQGTMQYTSNWGGLFAGIVIVVIPTILLYAVLGKQLIKGMTLGAGK